MKRSCFLFYFAVIPGVLGANTTLWQLQLKHPKVYIPILLPIFSASKEQNSKSWTELN